MPHLNNREMSELLRAYMKHGEYPGWPYAGAERVEKAYEAGGLDAVKTLVNALRNDPEAARRCFDSAVPATS